MTNRAISGRAAPVSTHPRGRRAFTLLEMMLVIAIIGLIAAVAVPQIMSRMDEARVEITRMQIRELETSINMFRLDNGVYPLSLRDLVDRPPGVTKWPDGGYLKEVPTDGWGHELLYVVPGLNGAFDLISYGSDGRPDGDGDAADIGNYSP